MDNRIKISLFFCFLLSITSVVAQDPIVKISEPSGTSHYLQSGEFKIGINENAGGVINYMNIPGVGNIYGPQAVLYGRSGQSAMRDLMHGQRYNPTQAGFNERWGTPVSIIAQPGALLMPARNCALWHGDGQWDFTEWENLSPDPYNNDGGNGDLDEIDETNLAGKQDTEVRSEFDYFGKYEDYFGKGGVNISCIRHYFEYRFIRDPGHCLNQFRPGLDIFKEDERNNDITTKFPAGFYPADDFDMSYFKMSWHNRHDVANWDPAFRFIMKSDGSWNTDIQSREEQFVQETFIDYENYLFPRLVIVSDSNDPNTGTALGLYLPHSEFNQYETVGVNKSNGKVAYKDQRVESVKIYETARRTETLELYGWKVDTKGLLNPTRLNNMYEAFRQDMYILNGTPNEIWDAVQSIESKNPNWQFKITAESWTGTSSINQSVNNGILNLQIGAANQSIMSPTDLIIDASLQKYLALKIKNKTSASNLEIRFKRYGSNQKYTQTVDVTANKTNFETLVLDMSNHAEWKGTISDIEIAFNTSSGQVDFDFIEVSSDDLLDCNGDFNGSSYIDNCGTCVDGNSGKEACVTYDCMGVENGSAYINNCGQCVGGTSALPVIESWNFNDLSSWTLNPRLTGYSQIGVAYLSITGGDPFMTCTDELCINTQEFRFLKIKAANFTNGAGLTFFFQNDLVSAKWYTQGVSIPKNGNPDDFYIVDMSTNPNWVGNVHTIRIDPPGDSGSFQFNHLELSKNDFNVGVKQQYTDARLNIFPNPANKEVYIHSDFPSQLRIYDLRGQLVLQTILKDASATIDISALYKGVYLVKVLGKKGEACKKLVIN